MTRSTTLVINISSLTYLQILALIEPTIYTYFSSDVLTGTVDDLIFKANEVFKFDLIVLNDIRSGNTPQERVKKLASFAKQQDLIDPTALKDFLDILLNFNSNQFSQQIKRILREKLDNDIDFVELDETTYIVNQSSSGRVSDSNEVYPLIQKFLLTMALTAAIVFTLFILFALFITVSTLKNDSTPSDVNVNNQGIPIKLDLDNISFRHPLKEPKAVKESVTETPGQLPKASSPGLMSKGSKSLTVKASSLTEYNFKMKNATFGTVVKVAINLDNPFSWPSGHVMVNSMQISHLSLSGHLAVDTIIVDILSQTPNVHHLRIKNQDNKLCQRNNGQLNLVKSIKQKAYLPLLRVLVLHGFTENCAEVWEALSYHLEELPQLTGLAVYKGVINNYSQLFLQQLLYLCRGNLRHLQLRDTQITITTPMFEGGGAKFTIKKLESVRIDSKSEDGTGSLIPIGSNFHDFIPNLHTLVIKLGFVAWRNMSNILVYSNLTNLNVGIQVPENHQASFNLLFLRKAYPLLKIASIMLNYESCGEGSVKKEIVGWETVKETLTNLTIVSNCEIYANLSGVQEAAGYYREQKYSSKPGLHAFTYRLIEEN